MPSMIASAGLLALSGMAAAFPQAGLYSNGTTNGTTAGAAMPTGTSSSTNSTSDPVTESLFCPKLSGSVIESKTGTSEFLLQCSTNYFGIIIDVQYNSTIFAKRQAAVAPASIQDCLTACDTVTGCVGTGFDTAARTCALYSEVGASYVDAGTDFAVRVAVGPAVSTIPAGGVATSTIYSTNVQTISSCAPTVTNCPLKSAGAAAATVTEVVAVSSTEYICPTAVVLPIKPVACSCEYSASTATVYSVSGTSAVSVGTKVVAVPSASGTTYSTTTVVGTGAAVTTAPMTVATNTAGATGASGSASPSAFTGGASGIKAAGAGMAGIVAAAAFML